MYPVYIVGYIALPTELLVTESSSVGRYIALYPLS